MPDAPPSDDTDLHFLELVRGWFAHLLQVYHEQDNSTISRVTDTHLLLIVELDKASLSAIRHLAMTGSPPSSSQPRPLIAWIRMTDLIAR
jgi:hypothetical protein